MGILVRFLIYAHNQFPFLINIECVFEANCSFIYSVVPSTMVAFWIIMYFLSCTNKCCSRLCCKAFCGQLFGETVCRCGTFVPNMSADPVQNGLRKYFCEGLGTFSKFMVCVNIWDIITDANFCFRLYPIKMKTSHNLFNAVRNKSGCIFRVSLASFVLSIIAYGSWIYTDVLITCNYFTCETRSEADSIYEIKSKKKANYYESICFKMRSERGCFQIYYHFA